MIPLSVVIITYNEEINIGRCIESVKEIADDIVVIDSYSTDGTESICKALGARFISHSWEGYSASKNFANAHAKYDWILSLDADEALSEKLKASIKAIKNSPSIQTCSFNRLTNYCGSWVRHTTWYPDISLRMFDRRTTKWEGLIHEKLVFAAPQKIIHLIGDCLHYSYYTLEQHYKQVELFTDIAAKNIYNKRKKPFLLRQWTSPVFKFISYYFFNLGFLDGKAGFLISKISSWAAYLKYKKARDLFKNPISGDFTLLVSRADAIGDMVLTLPMAGIVKEKYPGCKIIYLGKDYTQEIVALSAHINEFISYDHLMSLDKKARVQKLKEMGIDIFLHVFPLSKLASLAKAAKIPLRVGTTNRMYHWTTCNKLIKLSRKNSSLHEAQLNIKLLSFLNISTDIPLSQIPSYYGIANLPPLEEKCENMLSQTKKNVILHAKSRGSAREWGIDNFSRLISILPEEKYKVFITGTAAEQPYLEPLLEAHPHATNLVDKLSLKELIAFIGRCDALVAGSTGPLHIAAALGTQAIGLYSQMRPIHAGRWQPLGKRAQYLTSEGECPKCKAKKDCDCIKQIKPESVLALLEKN